MKKCRAGRYKIPEMFPWAEFPKGYTIVNRNESYLKIELLEGERSCYFQYVAAGDAIYVWLQTGMLLIADHEFEIGEFEVNDL